MARIVMCFVTIDTFGRFLLPYFTILKFVIDFR